MEVNGFTAGSFDAHGLVTIGRKKMPVIGADNGMLDAGLCQFSNGPREVIDDGIHDFTGREAGMSFTRLIDFL